MFASKSKHHASFKDLEAVNMSLRPFSIAAKWTDKALAIDTEGVKQLYLDRFAIGLSVLCAVHCLAVPVLLIVFPALTTTLHLNDHVFHELLLVLAIPSSAAAVFLGCKRHKDRLVFALGVLGLALLAATAYLGHDLVGESGEKMATLFAVSILAYAHVRNYSLCREESCAH